MYTHNPPEQFSLERNPPALSVASRARWITAFPLRLKHLQVREASSGLKSRGGPTALHLNPTLRDHLPTVEQRLTQLLTHQSCTCRLCEGLAPVAATVVAAAHHRPAAAIPGPPGGAGTLFALLSGTLH